MPTKPVITYKDNNAPASTKSGSIVMKRVGSTYQNWANKTELTDMIDVCYAPPTSDTYLYIICGCGEEYTYTTKNDVPDSNVTCSCGRKVIEYVS